MSGLWALFLIQIFLRFSLHGLGVEAKTSSDKRFDWNAKGPARGGGHVCRPIINAEFPYDTAFFPQKLPPRVCRLMEVYAILLHTPSAWGAFFLAAPRQ